MGNKSVHWVVKKVPTQTEMMYDKSRVIIVISKSSFLPEEQERRISRGYCRNDRSSSMHIYIYIYIYYAGGSIRGHLVVRGRVNAIMKVCISE